ncbi:MAG: pseudaminic acid synthase [Actinomycetota bacterium]|nr:pseudaminic acid synthase [Actinomycetota bacterium]
MSVRIDDRSIGLEVPPYIIAELSGNHGGSLARALDTVDAVAESGADAIKLQTYTADTMTLDVDDERFRITDPGSLWVGRHLHELYDVAHTPWEWHEAIFARAAEVGLTAFSSPFDASAVDFLVGLGVPALKIASFEITDLPLIRTAAATGLPLILSTGMATRDEIATAVAAAEEAGCSDLALLWCTSAYPAPADASRLRGIPDLRAWSGREVGLSDHTLGTAVAVAAVALGASIIEKHVTLDHELATVDGEFSLDPVGLAQLVRDTRTAWSALGEIAYGPSDAEVGSLRFRRGLYFVRDLAAGARIGPEDVRSLRPAAALGPDQTEGIVGRPLVRAVQRGDEVTREVLT